MHLFPPTPRLATWVFPHTHTLPFILIALFGPYKLLLKVITTEVIPKAEFGLTLLVMVRPPALLHMFLWTCFTPATVPTLLALILTMIVALDLVLTVPNPLISDPLATLRTPTLTAA